MLVSKGSLFGGGLYSGNYGEVIHILATTIPTAKERVNLKCESNCLGRGKGGKSDKKIGATKKGMSRGRTL